MRSQATVFEAATPSLFAELEKRAANPRDVDDVKRGMVRLLKVLENIKKKGAGRG